MEVGQDEAGIAADGGFPDVDGFGLAAEAPKRFAFFLAGEDEVVALGEGGVEVDDGFLETAEAALECAAVI